MKSNLILIGFLMVVFLGGFLIGTMVGQQSVTWNVKWAVQNISQQDCHLVKGIGYLPAGFIDYRLNQTQPVHLECNE